MRLRDGNVPFLVLFTLIDMAALAFRVVTSNQQVIAVKD